MQVLAWEEVRKEILKFGGNTERQVGKTFAMVGKGEVEGTGSPWGLERRHGICTEPYHVAMGGNYLWLRDLLP